MKQNILFLLSFITLATLSHTMDIKIVTSLTPKLNAIYDEKEAQLLIRHIAHEKGRNDLFTAWSLVLMTSNKLFKIIANKISRLSDISVKQDQQFTKHDLSDPWYVNTTSYKYVDQFCEKTIDITPLSRACETKQIQKIKDLINAGADLKHPINNQFLIFIASRKMQISPEVYLTIAELLLKNGADVNIRDSGITPLYEAVKNEDKEYVHLLLWYNADPEILITDYHGSGRYTTSGAFQIEQTGWLKKMVDEKQQAIFKCLLFKHHNFEISTLLPEIIKMVRYKVWEVYKNSFQQYGTSCIKKFDQHLFLS